MSYWNQLCFLSNGFHRSNIKNIKFDVTFLLDVFWRVREDFIRLPLVGVEHAGLFCNVPFPLFLLFLQTALSVQRHGPAWTSWPWEMKQSENKNLSALFSNAPEVCVSTVTVRTSSSCFSVSFISTSFSNLICSQASSKRLRVTILIFTSRRVFFAAVSKMWFHLLSCWWRHSKVIYTVNV